MMHIVIDKVKEWLGTVAKERDYFILDITFKREGKRMVFRVTLDREGGITVEECAKLSNEISEYLDRENIIEGFYILEVSSPGLDRKLITENDFVWAVGKKVRISTYVPIEGKDKFLGKIIGVSGNMIVVEEDGISTEIPRDRIAKAQLEPEINW